MSDVTLKPTEFFPSCLPHLACLHNPCNAVRASNKPMRGKGFQYEGYKLLLAYDLSSFPAPLRRSISDPTVVRVRIPSLLLSVYLFTERPFRFSVDP